jgi:hypothetical protein
LAWLGAVGVLRDTTRDRRPSQHAQRLRCSRQASGWIRRVGPSVQAGWMNHPPADVLVGPTQATGDDPSRISSAHADHPERSRPIRAEWFQLSLLVQGGWHMAPTVRLDRGPRTEDRHSLTQSLVAGRQLRADPRHCPLPQHWRSDGRSQEC